MRIVILSLALAVFPVTVSGATQPPASIRSVDFANHTYPIVPSLRIAHGPRLVTLRDGEAPESSDGVGMYLAHVTYTDVTGDGCDDAIVRLGVRTGGSAMPNVIYVFSATPVGLQLLWKFDTGDRADGGFRNAYSEAGALAVELYGPSMVVGGNYNAQSDGLTGACCPKHYTRTRYRWDGHRFRRVGTPETLVNTKGHGSPVDFQLP